MKHIAKTITFLLIIKASLVFGQNFFPLNIGNYWNLQERFSNDQKVAYSVKVEDTITIRDEIFYKCPISIGSAFNFKYLRLDTATNILIANYGDTSYPIINFNKNANDTFYYPVPSFRSPDDTIMGQIVKGGYRRQSNSNTITILFNPDTMMIDDEYYITLKEGVGLTNYYILGGYFDYFFLNAYVDGNIIGVVSNKSIMKSISSHLTNNKFNKQLNLYKNHKTNGSTFQLNGRQTNSIDLSKGIFVNKPSLDN